MTGGVVTRGSFRRLVRSLLITFPVLCLVDLSVVSVISHCRGDLAIDVRLLQKCSRPVRVLDLIVIFLNVPSNALEIVFTPQSEVGFILHCLFT